MSRTTIGARVAHAVVDIFPGVSDPLAEARHAIPRLAAVAAAVSASAGRSHVEHMA